MAIQADSGHVDSLRWLGVAYAQIKQPQTAAALFQQVIKLQPTYPMAHHHLGDALMEIGDPAKAMVAFRQETTLNPDFAPSYGSLAAAAVQAGDFDAARTAINTAIALDPGNAGFRFLRSELGEHDIAGLQGLIGSTTDTQSRSQLKFALAKALEAEGRHAEAFTTWLEGNAEKHRIVAYDEATTLGVMAQMQELFTPALLEQHRGAGHPSTRPIFIVGMPRSGTSLVEQILSSHPEVSGGGELTHAQTLIAALPEKLGTPRDFPSMVARMTGRDYHELGVDYLARIEAAPHVTDKMPANFFFLGFLHLALPGARIIHVVRDPLDTCLSCFTTLFGVANPFTYDLGELGRYHRAYRDLMAHWRRVLPILDVRYEDVVTDLEGQARRIVEYCALDWDSRCLDFHRSRRPVRTASATQVRRPIYGESVGRWRRYEAFLGPLLTELAI